MHFFQQLNKNFRKKVIPTTTKWKLNTNKREHKKKSFRFKTKREVTLILNILITLKG